MEGHSPIYRRLFERRSSPDLDRRWQFVQPSRRFGLLDVDPQRTLESLLDEFGEYILTGSGVVVPGDDELVLNPMLMGADRLAALIGKFDLVTSLGSLAFTVPLFAIDHDDTTYWKLVGEDKILFLVGSMQEYQLFDSLKMAVSPATYLDRLGRRDLQAMLYLVDGVSEGLITKEWTLPPGLSWDPSGYMGPDESHPPLMSLVFTGYELTSGRRGFTRETLRAMQHLFDAQQYLEFSWDQLYIWWPKSAEIADLEYRRGLSDVDLIKDFFCNLESLYTLENFYEFIRRERNTGPLARSLEDLLIAQDKAHEYPEMGHYREKKVTAINNYTEQVDRTTYEPLVESAMNSNDLRLRNLRLNLAHVSRLIHLGMPSVYSAQGQRMKSGDADENELIPEAKWKQMEKLLDVSVKLIREETRIRSRSRRS